MPELLTAREVATFFRLSVSSVRQMTRNHRIGYIRIGRSVRIPRDEVERLLREGRVGARRNGRRQELLM